MLNGWVYSLTGVRHGQTGTVVRDMWKMFGKHYVTVQFDGVAGDVVVVCADIEILN